MATDSERRAAQERFLKLLVDADLPAPDEIWWEERSTVFRWHEPRVVIYLDPDRDDENSDVVKAIEHATIRGIPVDELR